METRLGFRNIRILCERTAAGKPVCKVCKIPPLPKGWAEDSDCGGCWMFHCGKPQCVTEGTCDVYDEGFLEY